MPEITALILAGGAGERIKLITGGKPKTLLKLAGKYIIEYVLDNVRNAGITRAIMVVNDPREYEDIAIKYGKYMQIDLIPQKLPEIEGAILSVKDMIRSDFMLIYGDIIAPSDMYKELLYMYISNNNYGIVLVPEEELETYGIAIISVAGKIQSFIENPSRGTPNAYVIGGAFILPREFIEVLETYGSVIKALDYINKKYRLKPYLWSGWWIDIGYPWDLLRASFYVLKQINKTIISDNAIISPKAVIDGPVIIEDKVEIDHYAVIKGPAYIGKETYIGTHSLVRNYVTLEGGNIIGAYCEIAWSNIQKDASIGRGSYIGFSIIGSEAVVEPGVTTLNILPKHMRPVRAIELSKRGKEYVKLGAIIGHKARVPAGKILKPGEEIG